MPFAEIPSDRRIVKTFWEFHLPTDKAMFPDSVILVVGSESEDSETIARMLSDRYRVIGVEKPEDALTHASDGVNLVISELDSPDFSGLQLLRMWKARQPRTPFVFITDGGDVNSVIEAMKLGAADCIVKPVDPDELRANVSRLLGPDGADVGDGARAEADTRGAHRSNIDIPPGTSLEDLERAAVEQALAQHHGNRTHAAKTLGISVRTLQRKLKAWGMPVHPLHQGNGPGNNFLYTDQDAPAPYSHVH
jgi:DNA-binding NtrC family response regulator